jgi:hypothetical protein
MTTAAQKTKRIASMAGTVKSLQAREKQLTDATRRRETAEAKHEWFKQMPVDEPGAAPVAAVRVPRETTPPAA